MKSPLEALNDAYTDSLTNWSNPGNQTKVDIALGLLSAEKTEQLTNSITTLGSWAMPFQGVWLVGSSLNAAQIRDGLRQRTYKGDNVIVAPLELNNWATSNMSKEINDWLKTKLG